MIIRRLSLLCLAFLTLASFGTNSFAASESNATITLMIRFEVTVTGRPALEEILSGVSTAMQSEEGFVSAIVLRHQDQANTFILLEKWATRKSHEAHFSRINKSGDWQNIVGLLKQEPKLEYLERWPNAQ